MLFILLSSPSLSSLASNHPSLLLLLLEPSTRTQVASRSISRPLSTSSKLSSSPSSSTPATAAAVHSKLLASSSSPARTPNRRRRTTRTRCCCCCCPGCIALLPCCTCSCCCCWSERRDEGACASSMERGRGRRCALKSGAADLTDANSDDTAKDSGGEAEEVEG